MKKQQILARELKDILRTLRSRNDIFKYNQEFSLEYLIKVLDKGRKGVVIADEVGLGKTRIAIYTLIANSLIGESSIVLVPPGLMHQWVDEWNEVIEQIKEIDALFKRVKSIGKPIKIHRMDDIYTAADRFPICSSSESPNIVILPHTLNLYIKNNTSIDYIDLPQLIRAHDKKLSNNSSARLYFNCYFKEQNADLRETYGKTFCAYSLGKKNASLYLSKKKSIYSKDEKELISNSLYHFKDRPEKSNRFYKKYAEMFCKDMPGYNFLFKSFFELIGDCSLLVIDEAHKSKSDTGLEKVLGQIIGCIRKSSSELFTIGMTATPIELSINEWKGILNRVGENIENTSIIDNFHTSLKNIRINPSNKIFQKKIIEKSIQFEKFLNSNVTRRTRNKQKDYINLISSTNFIKDTSFPHHNRNIESIKIEELQLYGDNWLDLIFRFESLSKCLRGNNNISLRKAKLFDKTFVRGDLNSESLILIKEELVSNVKTSQDRRVLFWINKLIDSTSNIKMERKSHPRIDKTIEIVERIVLNEDGTFNEEKVLIFGTFTDSTRILNEKINSRLSLRLVDQGMLFPIGLKYLDELAEEYKYIDKSIFKNNLKNLKSPIKVILNKFRKKYISFRDKINDSISNDIFIKNSFIGDSFFKDNNERCRKAKQLFSFLLINDYLATTKININSKKGMEVSVSGLEMEKKINSEWKKIVAAYCGNEEVSFDEKSSEIRGDSFQMQRLDAYIDKIDDYKFSDIIRFALGYAESDDKYINNYTSHISRRIYGATPMNTRKNVQNQFNDTAKFPKILVAQSRVGREGLNLHKACRNLILFHQEWNPGVVEQQIGRIDRIESYWEKLLKKWIDLKVSDDNAPQINIFNIVFEGTYDEHQSHVLNERSKNLRAQLYGGILTEDSLSTVDEDFKNDIKKSAPDFSPQKYLSRRK